jgi:hypothetical protein
VRWPRPFKTKDAPLQEGTDDTRPILPYINDEMKGSRSSSEIEEIPNIPDDEKDQNLTIEDIFTSIMDCDNPVLTRTAEPLMMMMMMTLYHMH